MRQRARPNALPDSGIKATNHELDMTIMSRIPIMKRISIHTISLVGLLGMLSCFGLQSLALAQSRTPVVVIPFDSAIATKPKEPTSAVAIFRRDREDQPKHRENPIRLMRNQFEPDLDPDFGVDLETENEFLNEQIEKAVVEDKNDGTNVYDFVESEVDDFLDGPLNFPPSNLQGDDEFGQPEPEDDEYEGVNINQGKSFQDILDSYQPKPGNIGDLPDRRGYDETIDTSTPENAQSPGIRPTSPTRKPIPSVKQVEPSVKPAPKPIQPEEYPPTPKPTPEKTQTPTTTDHTAPVEDFQPKLFTRKHQKVNGCAVGPQFAFQGPYDHCTEFAPFGGFFIENPGTPIFDLGIGATGTDFFGYPQMGYCTERPYGWLFDNMEVFVGVSGFGNRSGSVNEKSFGIHEGVNWAGTVSPLFGISGQFGIRTTQRTIDGYHPEFETPDWDNSGSAQVFITTGLFKRSKCYPLQYGLVYDWMYDAKYKNKNLIDKGINLGQVRAELSYRCNYGWTFGIRGALGTTQDDPFETVGYKVSVENQLLGFFEKELWCGNSVRFSAGGSGAGNGILSAGYYHPINDKLSIQTGFAYMIAKEKNVDGKFSENDRDAWEAAFTLTFHPHGGAFSRGCNTGRAMFDVADNGSMLIYHMK